MAGIQYTKHSITNLEQQRREQDGGVQGTVVQGPKSKWREVRAGPVAPRVHFGLLMEGMMGGGAAVNSGNLHERFTVFFLPINERRVPKQINEGWTLGPSPDLLKRGKIEF